MIRDLVQRELVLGDLDVETRDDTLTAIAKVIAGLDSGVDRDQLGDLLRQRERQGSTAFGDGVAVPHARVPGLARMIVAFARSKAGIEWAAPDKRPVQLILMLAGPAEKPELYLKTLAEASRLLRDGQCRARLLDATDVDELVHILREDVAKGGPG